MSAPPLYILDTNILLALVRGKELGQRIDDAYGLSSSPRRPIISIVTEAELRTLARVNGWGEQKMRVVGHLLENVRGRAGVVSRGTPCYRRRGRCRHAAPLRALGLDPFSRAR